MNNINIGTISRTAILILALINQLLTVFGIQTLPIQDVQIHDFISTSFTIITALYAWWKNNSFTKEAIQADYYLKKMRGGD